LIAGETYEQGYPQKLGRGSCGNNIADSSREKAVNKPVFYLSTDFLGEGKLFFNGFLFRLGMGGFWKGGLRDRKHGTQGGLELLEWRLIRCRGCSSWFEHLINQ